jgi:hypothetical protein
MNSTAGPAYPVPYEGHGRYDWQDHHHWHHHRGWHAGPAVIGLMILGFLFCWPLGLVALALTIWSMKMMCGHHRHGDHDWSARWQERMIAKRARWEQRVAEHFERHHRPPTSGNRAFDEYRAETLRRLEDEEKEFREFLNNLRFAKDKAEFDDFLANRRDKPTPPETDAPEQN